MKLEKKKVKLAPEIELASQKKQKIGCGPACKPIEEEENCIPKKPGNSFLTACSPSCGPDSVPCPPDNPCPPDCSPN